MQAIAVTPSRRRSRDGAKHKPMSLIEKRVSALRPKIPVVLWQQQGLQVRRVVNRMRPGIRRQELEVIGESLLKIDIQCVVNRIAVRSLRVDRAERSDNAGGAKRTGKL